MRPKNYVTPEGERLTTDIARAAYLRTVQDWIVKPQIRSVRGVAGVDSIGGYRQAISDHAGSAEAGCASACRSR